MERPKRILICRSDRVGDLILTLPLFAATRQAFPDATIAALVNPAAAPLLEGHPDVDVILLDDARDHHKGPAGFVRLARELDTGNFDTALLPFCNWRLLSLVTSAGVKRRVGNGFRAYLPLLNKPVWIHRSHPPVHETTYCLAFLEPLGVEVSSAAPATVHLTNDERTWAREFLEERGVDVSCPIVGLHPGTHPGGVTMSPDRWVVATQLALDRLGTDTVVITGSMAERSLAERVAKPLGAKTIVLAGELDIRRLAAVQSQLSLVIAPGTDALYTAAAVNTPVLGFFPPLVSLSALKWRPLGSHVATVQPSLPSCKKCRSDQCKNYPCLDDISRKEIVSALERVTPAQSQP